MWLLIFMISLQETMMKMLKFEMKLKQDSSHPNQASAAPDNNKCHDKARDQHQNDLLQLGHR